MGDYFANLEAKLNHYLQRYSSAYDNDEYVRAAKWLYALNCAHPSKAFIKNMPKFQLRSSSLTALLDEDQKARRYCDHWNDLLEMAMTDFREANQAEYNRV